jgi:ankyrin repeat protein
MVRTAVLLTCVLSSLLIRPSNAAVSAVAAPILRPDSNVTITLQRKGTWCLFYGVTVSTDGIVFNAVGSAVAAGRHTDTIAADEVRKLAKEFIAAGFYSMDGGYSSLGLIDGCACWLSITVDGHKKQVGDYAGETAGMPTVITELETKVDALGGTARWIAGAEGLVSALRAEKFNFQTAEAQTMLKNAARQGQTGTVSEFLQARVPLTSPQREGWLTAASAYPETLRLLIKAGASKKDQRDKDSALAGAAWSGKIEGARVLIAYGANPDADVAQTVPGLSAGSVLIAAAKSGDPAMVREILRYHPNLERRDSQGRTAVFGVAGRFFRVKPGAPAECLRLLARAGANMNARDLEGNTPLHVLTGDGLEEELLAFGAHVNARNKDGNTPIFITRNAAALPLFIAHGADLSIRNNKGQTANETANEKGLVWPLVQNFKPR